MAYTDMLSLAVLILLPFLFIYYLFCKRSGLPTNWPFVGMVLPLIWNMYRLQDYITEMVEANGGNFLFQGPWFSHMRVLLVVDPTDIHYITSKNFSNFTKGPEFRRIFDILGEGIFNVDGDLWKFQRQMAHSFMGHERFRRFVVKTLDRKIEEGLIPILDQAMEQGAVVDLQDLFTRLTLDSICFFLTGRDPGCLSAQLIDVPLSKALADCQRAIILRHAMPESLWRLFRWLNVGAEAKMYKGWKILDEFTYKLIEEEKLKVRKGITSHSAGENKEDTAANLLTLYLGEQSETNKYSDKFLRDTVLNLLIAGRDTTSSTLAWLFWLLSNNPESESKIVEEEKVICESKAPSSHAEIEDLSKMIYLQAALCESMRLYPPIPINHKAPLTPDKLPSGQQTDPNTKILFPIYAMGRMKSIWGEDCLEFKPERWISERGKLKNVPPNKFFAFGAGPRICLGKDMSFIQVKVAVSSLIRKYRFEVVEGHPVLPDQTSVVLHMKHGLKVRVFNRCD
ncbi:hypothetical protein Droror1_Dr00005244 [Drosera rotundifolia]